MSVWDPFEDMDRMLTDVPGRRVQGFVPAVDVYQDDDNVYVDTELAGIDPEQVDVSIENDVLTIKGQSEQKSEVDEKHYYRKEVRRGSFYRSIGLPTHVVGDDAKAAYTDGILKITVPKAPEVKPKSVKIDVQK